MSVLFINGGRHLGVILVLGRQCGSPCLYKEVCHTGCRSTYMALFAQIAPKHTRCATGLLDAHGPRGHSKNEDFLLATHGPEAMMRATVCIDIVTHRPMSNGAPRIAKPGRCRARSRPPRTQRSRRRDVGDDRPEQLLLSHEVRFQRKSEASQRGHQPFNPWTTTFAQVYVHEQKKRLAKDGSVGPLWLYASNQRTLFMSYIARKNRPFDWEKAEAVDPLAPVKYALLLRCFRSHYRRVTARQALDPWLHARGFPSSTMQTICVSHKDLVSSTHLFLKDIVCRILGAPCLCDVGWLRGSALL